MSATAFNAMRRRRAAEQAAREAAAKVATTEKPLDKMNLAELDAKAAELGVVFPDNVKTKAARAAFLAEAIEAAAKAEAEAKAKTDAEAETNDNGDKTEQTEE